MQDCCRTPPRASGTSASASLMPLGMALPGRLYPGLTAGCRSLQDRQGPMPSADMPAAEGQECSSSSCWRDNGLSAIKCLLSVLHEMRPPLLALSRHILHPLLLLLKRPQHSQCRGWLVPESEVQLLALPSTSPGLLHRHTRARLTCSASPCLNSHPLPASQPAHDSIQPHRGSSSSRAALPMS